MSLVPEDLKCPLSNTLLRDAVTAPCCDKVANDIPLRESLMKTELKCPFCNSYCNPEQVSLINQLVRRSYQVIMCPPLHIYLVIKEPRSTWES